MKRKLKIFLIVPLILLLIYPINVSASEAEDSIVAQLESSLDDETRQILEDAGLNDLNINSLLKLDFRTILKLILKSLEETIKSPIILFPVLISAIMLLTIMNIGCFDYIKKTEFISPLFSSVIIGSISIGAMTDCIYKSVASLEACNAFSLTVIPVYAIVAAISAKPITFSAFNASMIVFCNAFSCLLTFFIIPFVSMSAALAFVSELNYNSPLKSISSKMKSFSKFVITVFMSVFAGTVSIKTNIASYADTLTSKISKTLISSSIPIIGGYISDSLTALKAGASALKGGIGVYAAVAVLILVLPSLVETLLLIFVFKLSDFICLSVNSNGSSLLNGFSDCLTIVAITQTAAIIMYIYSFCLLMGNTV